MINKDGTERVQYVFCRDRFFKSCDGCKHLVERELNYYCNRRSVK